MKAWMLLLSALLLLAATPASADELRPGFVELTQTGAQTWRLIWKAPMRGGVTPRTQPVLPEGCRFVGDPARRVDDQAMISRWTVTCTSGIAGKRIGLSDFSASRTDVLVRVVIQGRPVQALRLTARQPSAMIAARPDRTQVARTYFRIGVGHILFALDHVLFVFGLVLLLQRGWPLVKTVSAFTIAHSLTLIGTTLGVIGLPQRPVEAVIALSILFLAVEVAKKRDGAPLRLSERWPWLIALLFGLLHGFGFAGALAAIGLPEGEVPMALLTFNLGVEAGQLLILAGAMTILALFRRFAPRLHATAIRVAAYGIGVVSASWLFARTFA